jgi:SHS2 domain-containing protein
MGRYVFLEDIAVADCAIELEADSLADLFETAARALAELMVDPQTIRATNTRVLELTAASLDLLLYDWLAELIYLKDRDGLVFTSTRIEVEDGAPCRLTGHVEGGPIDPACTVLRADPKAVTLHQFVLERRAQGWRARVVIDI